MVGVARVFAHILLSPALRRKRSLRRKLRNPQRARRRPLGRRRTVQEKRMLLRKILNLSLNPKGGSYPSRKRNTRCSMLSSKR